MAVLGALEVTRDGRHVAVPAGKTSELVVRLALEAGELIRADRLVEDLWAADGVSARRNTLQSKIAMLRRALGDPPVVSSRDGGYALDVEPSDVDALAALSAATTASGLFEAGDDERCRRPVRLDVAALPRRCAPGRRRRRLGHRRTGHASTRPGWRCWRSSSGRGCGSGRPAT